MTLTRIIPATLALVASAAAAPAAENLLLEAEGFDRKGGWKVDQQFTHIVGSPYLLAHGMGKPVENAATAATFPETGTYRLWVRTRDWVPGDWEAPGRFRVIVDGAPVETVFGTKAGWGWQDGGTVTIGTKDVTVELDDLTGFDGRCDKLFFTTDTAARPPNEIAALRKWTNRLLGRPAVPPSAGRFDVVIVGGGISGCAAALAAANKGLAVALIQDRPVLGGNASSEVRVHTLGVHGKGAAILRKIDSRHWPNGSAEAIPDTKKRHAAMDAAANVRQFLCRRACAVNKKGNRIESVDARHIETGRTLRFRAPVFIDCTGDGWIGYWAGADYRYGRESRDRHGEAWPQKGELWSPAKPDNRVMGSSVLWNTEEADVETDFPAVPWAMDVAGDKAAVSGEWYWEYSANDKHQVYDAEEIRDHLLRAIYGSFANAKRNRKHAKRRLKWVAYIAGKRESRRLVGDYVYTMTDATERRTFPDTVVEEKRAIDVHYQRKLKGSKYDFLSEAIFKRTGKYYIPFRCLYSRNVENLMMAGRCFSCSHIGLGGPRVMNTCGQMGIATGYAAALCVKYETTPRGVYEEYLDELREIIGYGPAGEQQPAGAVRHTANIDAKTLTRCADKYAIQTLPGELKGLDAVAVPRGDSGAPAPGLTFTVNLPVTVYLLVHDRGNYTPPKEWKKTDLSVTWFGGTHSDTVYRRDVPAGTVAVPGHRGTDGPHCGVPNMAIVKARVKKQSALKITPAE